MVPKKLYQLALTACHDLMGHNGTMQLYGYIRRFYFGQKLKQDCTKHLCQCKECWQIPLKEPHYLDSNLHIPKLPMSFIVMDLLGEYPVMENGICYASTIICMLTPFVSIIPIKDMKLKLCLYHKFMQIREDHNLASLTIGKNCLGSQWHILQTN